MQDETQKFIDLIFNYQFDELNNILGSKSDDEISDDILELAYDHIGFLAYTFALFRINKQPTAFNHYLASRIMNGPLCHVEKGFHVAFYHAKEAIRLSPDNMEYKEYILMFYNHPDKLLKEQEAALFAQEVYKSNPESEAAKFILLQTNWRKS